LALFIQVEPYEIALEVASYGFVMVSRMALTSKLTSKAAK
jgi:hypothetical protein